MRRLFRIACEIAVAGIGILLLAGAMAANQPWLDQHFLPGLFLPRRELTVAEMLARLAMAAAGMTMFFFVRPWTGRLVARMPPRELVVATARILLAVGLAVLTSEVILRYTFARATEERPADEEPLRKPDPRLGWVFVPARTGHAAIAGRDISYVFDAAGYRVRGPAEPVDTDRPTILFTGESIVSGYGLNWNETYAAQDGALLGVQSANIAVFGYANDQAYLRLTAELSRFHRPVAVVSLFMPSLFFRNMDDDRPHLGPGLVWQPANHRWRLEALFRYLFAYHSVADIDRALAVTREILVATARAARARGATPLVVVPQFGPEDPAEQMIRSRVLDGSGLDYVRVRLDPAWHLPGDEHPDARAAHAIAAAIAARLGPQARFPGRN